MGQVAGVRTMVSGVDNCCMWRSHVRLKVVAVSVQSIGETK